MLGVVKGKEKDSFSLTEDTDKVNTLTGGKLVERLQEFPTPVGPGDTPGFCQIVIDDAIVQGRLGILARWDIRTCLLM